MPSPFCSPNQSSRPASGDSFGSSSSIQLHISSAGRLKTVIASEFKKSLAKLVKLTKFRILQAFLWFLNLVKLTKLIKLTKFTLGSRVWRRAFETHGLFSGAQSSKSSHLLPGTNKKHLAPLRHLNGHQDRRRACFHARQPSHAPMRQSTTHFSLTT